jgi:hypothetical protein
MNRDKFSAKYRGWIWPIRDDGRSLRRPCFWSFFKIRDSTKTRPSTTDMSETEFSTPPRRARRPIFPPAPAIPARVRSSALPAETQLYTPERAYPTKTFPSNNEYVHNESSVNQSDISLNEGQYSPLQVYSHTVHQTQSPDHPADRTFLRLPTGNTI